MFPRVLLRLGAGALLAMIAARVTAAEPPNLRDFLFGQKLGAGVALPAVARYEANRGSSFVLDREGGRRAVLKYDDSAEVWALTATQGPRGDVMYKNDMGQTVLRATRLGGMTLFTPDQPEGSAAALLGPSGPPRAPPVMGPAALLSILVQASGRASRAAHHLILFDATEATATPATEPVFADAFILAADAIVRVSTRGRAGQAVVSRLAKVRFVQGGDPEAALLGQIVQITIAPPLGVAGRPSSQRIEAAIIRR